jgi:hypothetical protein
MSIVTERATQAEKAAAWDHMMHSTNVNADEAVMLAWEWLSDTVQTREETEEAEAMGHEL